MLQGVPAYAGPSITIGLADDGAAVSTLAAAALIMAVGFLWQKKKDAAAGASLIGKSLKDIESDVDWARLDVEKLLSTPVTVKRIPAELAKLESFCRTLEALESAGGKLKPQDHLARGMDLYYRKKYDLAVSAFEKAVAVEPGYVEAWHNMGISLFNLDRFEDAIKAFDRAIELKPDNAGSWYNKGLALGSLGRYEDEVLSYDRAIVLKPDYAEAWNNMGVAFIMLERYQDVVTVCGRAVAVRPGYAEAWNNIGFALFNLGRNDEALNACNRAVELKPGLAEAWFNAGSILINLRRYDEAVDACNRALELIPGFLDALFTRACAYALKGNRINAFVDLRGAVERDRRYAAMSKTSGCFKDYLNDEAFLRITGMK